MRRLLYLVLLLPLACGGDTIVQQEPKPDICECVARTTSTFGEGECTQWKPPGCGD